MIKAIEAYNVCFFLVEHLHVITSWGPNLLPTGKVLVSWTWAAEVSSSMSTLVAILSVPIWSGKEKSTGEGATPLMLRIGLEAATGTWRARAVYHRWVGEGVLELKPSLQWTPQIWWPLCFGLPPHCWSRTMSLNICWPYGFLTSCWGSCLWTEWIAENTWRRFWQNWNGTASLACCNSSSRVLHPLLLRSLPSIYSASSSPSQNTHS